MDLRKLKKLIDLVQESGIAELEITEGEEKVRIVRGGVVSTVAAAMPAMSPVLEAPRAAPSAVAAPAPAGESAAVQAGHVVKAPMVGTFYRSPTPDAPSYVEVGSRVVRGQTLCILEAMKLMNELQAEVAGVVREVCVENAEPVEYGQVLFRIEPDA